MTFRPWQAAGIVIPIIVMAGWISSYVFQSTTGTEVTFKIQGFDPRDLLSGHYVRYQVDYQATIKCKNRVQKTLCLEPTADGTWRAASALDYTADPGCSVFLHATCRYGRLEAGIERFYFPEAFKSELRVVPPNSTIDVAITGKGKGIVKAMHVDGQPVVEWAREQVEQGPLP